MAKSDSMLAILWMLSPDKKITAKQIANKLEINIRTVYRYIDALSASGVPIISESGQNGGYSLLPQFSQTPLLFDVEEQAALLQASIFAKEAGYPLSEALTSATQKLRHYTNDKQEALINQHLRGFEVQSQGLASHVKPILMQLEKAVVKQLTIDMHYSSSHAKAPEKRAVDPYGILYWNNKWYVAGFCHLRGALRCFRAERISQVELTPISFTRPADFSVKAYLTSQLLPSIGPQERWVQVTIKGRPEAIDDLNSHWYFGHHLVSRSQDRLSLLVPEKGLTYFVPYYLLSYGRAIRILEPSQLKENLSKIAAQLSDYYRD